MIGSDCMAMTLSREHVVVPCSLTESRSWGPYTNTKGYASGVGGFTSRIKYDPRQTPINGTWDGETRDSRAIKGEIAMTGARRSEGWQCKYLHVWMVPGRDNKGYCRPGSWEARCYNLVGSNHRPLLLVRQASVGWSSFINGCSCHLASVSYSSPTPPYKSWSCTWRVGHGPQITL